MLITLAKEEESKRIFLLLFQFVYSISKLLIYIMYILQYSEISIYFFSYFFIFLSLFAHYLFL